MVPLRRPLGTFHQQLCRHRDNVTAEQYIESYLQCLPEEHVNGSPEEFYSLVPARVQQRRKVLLQDRENHLQCDWHGGELIRAIRWSDQSVVAHEAATVTIYVYGQQ